MHKWSVQKGNNNSTYYFVYWNNVFQEVLRFMCIHEIVRICLFVPKHGMKINSESKRCLSLPSFILLKNTPWLQKFLVLQFWRKSCPWKILFECPCVCPAWCTVYLLCKIVCVCVLSEQVACSRVDAKGQQFVGVQIVEGAQVWQAQKEFREEGSVIWTALGDQWP